MKRKRIIIGIVVTLFAVIVGFLLRHPPDPLTLCQKMLDSGFEQWKQTNKANGYPNVHGDSTRSFAAAGVYMKGGGEDFNNTYGYVPGLKDDDPKDLVLMYLEKKTRRTWNGDFSGSILRKPKWMVIGPDFGFDLPEGGNLEETSTFKTRLQKTLDFLRENKRPYWETIVKEHTEFLNSIKE